MYCINCGASVDPKGKYCPKCGEKLYFHENSSPENTAEMEDLSNANMAADSSREGILPENQAVPEAANPVITAAEPSGPAQPGNMPPVQAAADIGFEQNISPTQQTPPEASSQQPLTAAYICPSCGAQNPVSKKFCSQCGTPNPFCNIQESPESITPSIPENDPPSGGTPVVENAMPPAGNMYPVNVQDNPPISYSGNFAGNAAAVPMRKKTDQMDCRRCSCRRVVDLYCHRRSFDFPQRRKQ